MWRKHQREQTEGISGVVRMPRGMFVFVCVDWQTDRLLCQVSEVFDKVSNLQTSKQQTSRAVLIMMPWGALKNHALKLSQHQLRASFLKLVGHVTTAMFLKISLSALAVLFENRTNMCTMAVMWGVATVNGKDHQLSLWGSSSEPLGGYLVHKME